MVAGELAAACARRGGVGWGGVGRPHEDRPAPAVSRAAGVLQSLEIEALYLGAPSPIRSRLGANVFLDRSEDLLVLHLLQQTALSYP